MGRIRVVNRCRKENGEIDEAEGEAKLSGDDAPKYKTQKSGSPPQFSHFFLLCGEIIGSLPLHPTTAMPSLVNRP